MKRRIIPSATKDLIRIGQDYQLAEVVEKWCRLIVMEADRSDRPVTGLSEVALGRVLDELENATNIPASDWTWSWQKFRAAGWFEKVKALRCVLLKRTPPWSIRLNSRVFHGLDGAVPVEVETMYDVDLPNGFVTFLRFDSYTPEQVTGIRADDPVVW